MKPDFKLKADKLLLARTFNLLFGRTKAIHRVPQYE